MVRPRKWKKVGFKPEVTYFKPRAVALKDLEEVTLSFEELETLRLVNQEKLSQGEAAELMEVHQSTFQRTLTRAREKVTDALVDGKAIKIEGGNFKMPNKDGTGPDGEGPKTGRGLGKCGKGQGRELGRGRKNR
jgi:uncharacterized protein